MVEQARVVGAELVPGQQRPNIPSKTRIFFFRTAPFRTTRDRKMMTAPPASSFLFSFFLLLLRTKRDSASTPPATRHVGADNSLSHSPKHEKKKKKTRVLRTQARDSAARFAETLQRPPPASSQNVLLVCHTSSEREREREREKGVS